LRHDDSHDHTHDEDAPHNVLETCAAPLPWTQRARLLHDTLTEICDLCQVEPTTAEILVRHYVYGVTKKDIKRTYGVTLRAALKRMQRAIKKHPVRGAQAKAALRELITAMHRTEDVSSRKRTRPEKVKADEDVTSLYTSARGWRGQNFPTLPKRHSPDTEEE